jgi:hypothetical protein
MVLLASPESTSPPAPIGPGPRPAPRHKVLALLRDGSDRRPRFHPGLAGGLRAWLEDAASDVVAARGEDAPPLFLSSRVLGGTTAKGDRPEGLSPAWVTSCLVHALFRQLVTTGSVGEPLTDALAALGVDPGRSDIVEHVVGLGGEERAALMLSLQTHVNHLRDLTPRFAPGWLPRTDDRVAIPLAGGRVILSGVFDLLVGAPLLGAAPGTASVCVLGLSTGGRWVPARTTLHYLALLETLRSGTPPFRLGLLHSAVGRYDVEDVTEEHLRAIVSHLATHLTSRAAAHG